MEIIKALKEADLTGLGGAGFPTYLKWQGVRDSADQKRFVICNLSEGEPGVFKDEFIIVNHLQELVAGIQLAANAVLAQKSYIFLNDKYKKYANKIHKVAAGKKIEIFIDTGRYLCGEETTLLQVMEGKLRQPRSKPPYPTEKGLFGFPTLINNAETLYRAYLISVDKYKPERFYSVSGDYVGKKIVEANRSATIEEIIGIKNQISAIKFFRIGGASGYFLPASEIAQKVLDTGSIEVFGQRSKILDALIESIIFLKAESCGKCTPCREGTYRIAQSINKLLESKSIWDRKETIDLISEIAKNAERSSFCGLGKSISKPVVSAIKYFSTELSGE